MEIESYGKRKAKTLNSKQLTFYGTGNENEKDWLFSTNLNMEAAHVDEEDKTTIAAGYLRNNALQVYRQAVAENDKIDWDDFQNLMIKKFSRKDSETDLIKQLMELKGYLYSIFFFVRHTVIPCTGMHALKPKNS